MPAIAYTAIIDVDPGCTLMDLDDNGRDSGKLVTSGPHTAQTLHKAMADLQGGFVALQAKSGGVGSDPQPCHKSCHKSRADQFRHWESRGLSGAQTGDVCGILIS